MALSFAYLGLCVLSISLFLSNYVIIRALRLHVDAFARFGVGKNTNTYVEDGSFSFKERLLRSTVLLFLTGPFYFPIKCLMDYYEKQRMKEKERLRKLSQEQDITKVKLTAMETGMAFFLGYIRPDMMAERRFPFWRPIPYRLSVLTTVSLILIFSVLMSRDVLTGLFGIDPAVASPTVGLCNAEQGNESLTDILEKLFNRTNYVAAKQQYQVSQKFLEALQNDTTLWGEDGYHCNKGDYENDTYSKEEFRNSSRFGREEGVHFFPGVCREAQAHALELAREQTCSQTFCSVHEIVDPESITATNGAMTGLDALRDSVGIEGMDDVYAALDEINVDTNINFRRNLGSAADNAAKIYSGDAFIRVTGQEAAEQALGNIQGTVDTSVLGNEDATADWDNMNETFCADHIVPCPDYSRYDELSTVVMDFAQIQLEKAAQATYEFAEPAIDVAGAQLSEAQQELIDLLLFQLEVASNLYVIYACLCLFFPNALVVFKKPLVMQIRDFLFGAQKYTFMLIAVSLWWIVQYFRTFELIVQFEVYMKLFLQDPCIGDVNYLAYIGGNHTLICSDLEETASKWRNINATIHNIFTMIPMMNDCCSNFPGANLAANDANFPRENSAIMDTLGFFYNSSAGDGFGFDVCEDCFLPNSEVPFVANMTACMDSSFVRREILNVIDQSDINWWSIWINSGVLASILLKTCITSFGIGLLKLADPLVVCDGRYEGPPESLDFKDWQIATLQKRKELGLRKAAQGTVIVWGFLTIVMMLNIVLAEQEGLNVNEIDPRDLRSGIVLIFIAFVPPCMSIYVRNFTQKKIKALAEAMKRRKDGGGHREDAPFMMEEEVSEDCTEEIKRNSDRLGWNVMSSRHLFTADSTAGKSEEIVANPTSSSSFSVRDNSVVMQDYQENDARDPGSVSDEKEVDSNAASSTIDLNNEVC